VPGAALARSEVIVACLIDHEAVRAALERPSDWAGRRLVNRWLVAQFPASLWGAA
jgi:hypothetical protein